MQAAIFIKPDLSLIYFNYGLNKLTHQSLTLEIEYGGVILIIRKVLVLVQVQLEEHNNQLQWPSWVFSFWTKESGFKSIIGTQGMSRTRLQTVSKLDFLSLWIIYAPFLLAPSPICERNMPNRSDADECIHKQRHSFEHSLNFHFQISKEFRSLKGRLWVFNVQES